MERRLAAILATDVVGYSRLMNDDEEGTLTRLKAHRDEVFDPTIGKHRGRIVKLMGDGALAEFASIVDSVRCAVDIQEAMSVRNADVPEDRRIQLRIGVNLGDVIVEGDDIYGDGVNIAARLEGLAEPGGVCVSGTVFDHVKGKVDLDPNYATAWTMLGWGHHHEVDVAMRHASKRSREAALGSALDCANKALDLDPSYADAYCLLAICHLSKGEHDQAIAMSVKAVELAPNHAEVLGVSAITQNKSGRPERSLEMIRKAMRLCPVYPSWYLWVLGTAYRLTCQIDFAIGAFEAAIKRDADYLAPLVGLASTLGEVGREEDAKTFVSEILRIDPDFSIKKYMGGLSYRDPAVSARFEDGLRKAGLPE